MATDHDSKEVPGDLEAEPPLAFDDWEVLENAHGNSRHLVFVPSDEEAYDSEAFIVADAASVCDLLDSL
jgi:hypothetical protein